MFLQKTNNVGTLTFIPLAFLSLYTFGLFRSLGLGHWTLGFFYTLNIEVRALGIGLWAFFQTLGTLLLSVHWTV